MVVVLTTPARKESFVAQLSHLGSDIVADCFTRPQYVLRSYCEVGRSRFPGSEDVILCGRASSRGNDCRVFAKGLVVDEWSRW